MAYVVISDTISYVFRFEKKPLRNEHRTLSRQFFFVIFLCFILLSVVVNTNPCHSSLPELHDSQIIWVVSHRRSGTHLTMDLISNLIQPPFRIVKTNHIYMVNEDETASDPRFALNCRCLNYMKSTGKVVHAYRDVRDVVVSMYYYYRSFNASRVKNMEQTDFYNNAKGSRDYFIDTWINTTVPWFAQEDVLQLNFSETVSRLENTFDKITEFLGKQRSTNFRADMKYRPRSHPVHQFLGKGDRGYLKEMTESNARDILKTARDLEIKKKRNLEKCTPDSIDSRWSFLNVYRYFPRGFYVGRKGHNIFVPYYCPSALKTSVVVQMNR